VAPCSCRPNANVKPLLKLPWFGSGPVKFRPNPFMVALTLLLTVAFSCLAFWFVFRFNEWRRRDNNLRIISALALAVASLGANYSCE
jgi:NO-binding membrane sensor protein with MHYT domain